MAKSTSGYIVGDRLTIADISNWSWIASHRWAGLSLDDTPHLKAWFDRVLARPGIEKGRHVPSRHSALDNVSDEDLEKRAATGRAWVQQGMADDAAKLKK